MEASYPPFGYRWALNMKQLRNTGEGMVDEIDV
jgi:hypothetical protein